MLGPDRAPIAAMMVGQTVIWAALFYSFPALVLPWQAEFGWSSSQVMGALTLAVALYALGAPLYGRLIDRGWAGWTMPLAGLVGAALLCGVAWVEGLVAFYVLWGLIGVTQGLTLYEAAFAIVTRARGPRARSAITAITLMAGFASSLAYPLIAWLSGMMGWRGALLVMAALIVVVNVPLVRFAARRLEAEVVAAPATATPQPRASLLRNPRFWPLAAGFALASFATGTILSHLFPMMAAQGIVGALAVTAAALIGPAQVVGRVLMMTLGARAPSILVAQIGMGALAVGALAIWGAVGWPFLVLVFALAQGGGYGVVGILRAVIVQEVLGQRDYGAIAGAVALPALLAFAFAPVLGAVVVDMVGYGPLIAICAAAPVLGALCLALSHRQMQNGAAP